MKFISLAVAAVVAASVTSAERCYPDTLEPIIAGLVAKKCAKETGFKIDYSFIDETIPTPEQQAAICASEACRSVYYDLYAAVPTDCTLIYGKTLKELTDPVKDSCPILLQPPRCTQKNLLPKLVRDVASDCMDESGNNLAITVILGERPTPQELKRICASNSCKTLLKQIYAAGCTVPNADYLKCE